MLIKGIWCLATLIQNIGERRQNLKVILCHKLTCKRSVYFQTFEIHTVIKCHLFLWNLWLVKTISCGIQALPTHKNSEWFILDRHRNILFILVKLRKTFALKIYTLMFCRNLLRNIKFQLLFFIKLISSLVWKSKIWIKFFISWINPT